MSLPQKPPRKGGRARAAHFSFAGTPKGGCWEAYVAGPCHWFDCHEPGRTKPCLHEITNGELTCEYNHDIYAPVERGYLPLYSAYNGKPCFVLVHDYTRDTVDKLKLHCLVDVSRGKAKNDTVAVVHTKLNAARYTSTREDFMRPADLTESLLRIWKMPELTNWYRITHGMPAGFAESKHRSAPKPDDVATPPPTKKMYFPAAELAGLMEVNAEKARDRAERSERNAEWLRQQAAEQEKKKHGK